MSLGATRLGHLSLNTTYGCVSAFIFQQGQDLNSERNHGEEPNLLCFLNNYPSRQTADPRYLWA